MEASGKSRKISHDLRNFYVHDNKQHHGNEAT